MNTEKRLILALVITFGFFLLYSRFFPQQQPAEQQIVTQPIEQQEVVQEEPSRMIVDVQEPAETKQVKMDNYVITYVPQGGYVKTLEIAKYNDTLNFQNIGLTPADIDLVFDVEIKGNKLIFKGRNKVVKEFEFNGYEITIRYQSPRKEGIVVFSNPLSTSMLDQRYQECFIASKDEVTRIGAKKIKRSEEANVTFAGFRDRYFCASLLPGAYDLDLYTKDENVYLRVVNPVDAIKIYVGPQSTEILKQYGLEGIISFGFFHIIGVALLNLLKLFHTLTKSWGISIILLSMTAYGIMFPFTAKSTKAMKKMQQVQPEVEAIKQKYKDNPQKMNKEVMELYKKYKLNPLGGCLPLFFQFPVFISLYQILLRFVQLKGASFLWIKDLSMPDRLLMFPGNFKLPILNTEYFNLLPILVMTLGIIQQKITTSASTAGEQKKIGLFFAVFLGFIFYNFPSALVLYWFVQNFLTLIYQYRISRQ